MKKMGLLLTPEIAKWSRDYSILQSHCCFTELAPVELRQHARKFGRFAIEFDIKALRTLGGIPVFYLPRKSKTGVAAEKLSEKFVVCLAEIGVLLDRLMQLEGTDGLPAVLTEGNQPLTSLRNTFRNLSGFFYPAENLKHTGLLGYYRQREWRIAANIAQNGVLVARCPNEGEVKWLLELDQKFFGRRLKHPSTGEKFRIVDGCRVFERLNRKRTLRYARRVIVPAVAVERAKEILNDMGDRVVALESISPKHCTRNN
jgi:hypothetical protein